MKMLWIALALIVLLLILITVLTYICFRLTFFVTKKQKQDKTIFDTPIGKIYEPYRESMEGWMKETDALPYTDYQIRSFDGLTLRGKYYEKFPDAPIEIMFHGYRGSARRDLCGGVQRCFSIGRNALVVDQRASGQSEGSVIGFGIHESEDCLAWIDFAVKELGPDVKIMLTGISMGAATVLSVADKPLPPNVVGILADCGFSSAKEIIMKVVRDIKLPPRLLYPFIHLGARWFGKLRLNSSSPIKAVQNSKVPILFIHGDTDDFVPCDMSLAMYEACGGQKMLLTVKGAGHGLAYPADPDGYYKTLSEFSQLCGIPFQKQ